MPCCGLNPPGRVSSQLIAGRRREATALIGEQTRELDGRRVRAFGPDNLQSDRQARRGQAAWGRGRRPAGETRQSGPEALAALGGQPPVPRDQARGAIRIAVVREGTWGGSRTHPSAQSPRTSAR